MLWFSKLSAVKGVISMQIKQKLDLLDVSLVILEYILVDVCTSIVKVPGLI